MHGQRILSVVLAAWLGLTPALSAEYYRFTPGKGATTAGSGGGGSGGAGSSEGGTKDGGQGEGNPGSQPAALSFSRADNLSGTYPANSTVEGTYEVAGGSEPYSATATGLPDGLYFFQSGAAAWTLSGTVGLQGGYPSGAVVVTDGAGASVTHPISMTVSGTAPMAVTSQFPSTATVRAGEDLDLRASFTGGSGSYDYAVADQNRFGANGSASPYGSVSLAGTSATPGTYPLKVTVTDTVTAQALALDTVTVTVTAPTPFSVAAQMSVRRHDGVASRYMEYYPGGGSQFFVTRGLVRGGGGDGFHRTVTATVSQPSKYTVEARNVPCSERQADCAAIPGYADGDTLIEVVLTPLVASGTSTLSVAVKDAAGQAVTFAPVVVEVNAPS